MFIKGTLLRLKYDRMIKVFHLGKCIINTISVLLKKSWGTY